MDVNPPARERREQEYSPIQATGSSRLHAGNVYNIDNYRTRFDDDSDTDPEERSLPKGWDAAKSQDGETYYVSPISPASGNGTTTWVKPMHDLARADASIRKELGRLFSDVLSPELVHSSNTVCQEAATVSTSHRSDAEDEANMGHIDPVTSNHFKMAARKHSNKSRCSIFTGGRSIIPENLGPADAVGRLLEERQKNEDSICIIENIDGGWIDALHAVSELNLPSEFFARHTSNVASRPARQGTYIPLMDDLVQRAIPSGKRIQKKKAEESVKKIIDTLSETRECVKTSVDNWVMCGVTEEELDRVASCVAECTSTLDKLKGKASAKFRSASVGSSKIDPFHSLAERSIGRWAIWTFYDFGGISI
jgi:hypothetical protein